MVGKMINKLSLNEQIYETLKREIFTGQIKSGSILVNKDLQERFGVSSSPIRDAINRLKEDGIITNITRAGAEIITLDYEITREINELMVIINVGALKLCSKRDNKEEIVEKLEEALKVHEEHLYTNEYFYYDFNFHKILFDNSNNNHLRKLYIQFSALFEIASRSFDTMFNDDEHRETSIETHREIVKALKADDVDKASVLIEEHYQYADDIFRDYFKN